MPHPQLVGIIGAGVIGLSCADTLTDAGFSVTVVARDLPGDESLDWASPWAGACILPERSTEDRAFEITSFLYFWQLAQQQPDSGVQVVPVTEYFDDNVYITAGAWRQNLLPRYRRLTASELPAGVRSGSSFDSTTINPPVYLAWLKKKLCEKGVQFITAEVKSLAEAQKLTNTTIIVNASGLGAQRLAHDEKVLPVRGQTMLVKSEFNRVVIRQGSEYTYAIPRKGSGVVIGGIAEEGSTDARVNTELEEDILSRVNRLTGGAFKDAVVIKHIVGFRPGRDGGHRVERDGNVIHAYGFRGHGYLLSYGVANQVRDMVVAATSQQQQFKAKL